MKRVTLFLWFILSLMLAACGPTLRPPSISPDLLRQEAAAQREFIYKSIVEKRIKLTRLYLPLRLANADLCFPKNLSPVTGMTGIDRASLDPDLREIAQRVHGLSDGVKIIDIVPQSPADKAGLLAGDVIAGAAKGSGMMPSGWSWSGLTIADLAKIIESSDGESITLLVRRNDNTFPMTLFAGSGCRFPIELKYDERFNAAADGSKIIINTGALNYVSDDQQLAFLISHELAHNILLHVQKMQGNAAAGAVAGAIFDIGLAAIGVNTQGLGMRTGAQAGALVFSKEFEAEADYLGIYMAARAGFDIAVVPDFFRRIAIEKPSAQAQTYSSTHPSTPERAVAMQQTIAEIAGKMRNGEPLVPRSLAQEKLALEQKPSPPLIVETAIKREPPAVALSPLVQSSTSNMATASVKPAVNSTVPAPTRVSGMAHNYAQLYLIKGKIVSNPPQTFSAEFFEDGKASVTLSGRRLLTGKYEIFDLGESIRAKQDARIINPDSLKPFAGADAKGFALFSDVDLQLECVYGLIRSTSRGEGMCADTQGNTYRIGF